jgi:hypothetical protein
MTGSSQEDGKRRRTWESVNYRGEAESILYAKNYNYVDGGQDNSAA